MDGMMAVDVGGKPIAAEERSEVERGAQDHGDASRRLPQSTTVLRVQWKRGAQTAPYAVTISDKSCTARDVCSNVAHVRKTADDGCCALLLTYPTVDEDGSITEVLHTLKADDRPLQVLRDVVERSQGKARCISREKMLANVKWYATDVRGPPPEFSGYVSGSEASDDERDAPWTDAASVGQGYHSGYLLKRSTRDPCLWRKRYCVLGEDKLWYMKLKSRRTEARKVSYLPLVSNQVLELPTSSNVPFAFEVHTAHRVFVLRAADRQQQLSWIRAIQTRIDVSSENDLIGMAELMICDEESARARRMVATLESVWQPDHGGARRGGRRADVLAFAAAVQEFRELCKHRLCRTSKKWEVARSIFEEFLRRWVDAAPPVESDGLRAESWGGGWQLERAAVQEVEGRLLLFEAAKKDGAFRLTSMPVGSVDGSGTMGGRPDANGMATIPPPSSLFDGVLEALKRYGSGVNSEQSVQMDACEDVAYRKATP